MCSVFTHLAICEQSIHGGVSTVQLAANFIRFEKMSKEIPRKLLNVKLESIIGRLMDA